jgi:hypothetical protein
LGFFNDFFRVLIVVLRSDLSDWFNLEKKGFSSACLIYWFFFERFQLNF